MQNTAVKFPYWENIGRGWEDVKVVILLFQFILLLIPAGIITIFLIIRWKNRNFTWKDVWNFLLDSKDKLQKKARGTKDKWQHF